MYCPKCGTKNPDGMRFCGNCGFELPLITPQADQGASAPQGASTPPAPAPQAAVEAPPTRAEERVPAPSARSRKGGLLRFIFRLVGSALFGALVIVLWIYLQPRVIALLTAYGRHPDTAEAVAQHYVDENFPELSYASRMVTFSEVDGIPCYVVDFIGETSGVRLLVDRLTLEVTVAEAVGINGTGTDDSAGSPASSAPPNGTGETLVLPAMATMVLDSPQVTVSHDFSSIPASGWSTLGNVSLDAAGEVVLQGDGAQGAGVAFPPMAEGHGALVRFSLADPSARFEIYLESGEWETEGYLSLGIALDDLSAFQPQAWKGTRSRPDQIEDAGLQGTLSVSAGRWYGLFIGADDSGYLRVYAWDWDDPNQYVWTGLHRGITWDDRTWNFKVQVAEGLLYIDDYAVVQFSGFR